MSAIDPLGEECFKNVGNTGGLIQVDCLHLCFPQGIWILLTIFFHKKELRLSRFFKTQEKLWITTKFCQISKITPMFLASAAIVAIDCSCTDVIHESLVSLSPWNTFKWKNWPSICPWVSILFHVNLRSFIVLGDFRLSTAFPAFENKCSASVHWLTFLWTRTTP